MTQVMAELGDAARSFARQGVVAVVLLSLTLGITASLALAVLERAEGKPS
jgi:hypothetical protein